MPAGRVSREILKTPYSRPEYMPTVRSSARTSPVPVASPKKRIAQRRFSSTVRNSRMMLENRDRIHVDHQRRRIPLLCRCESAHLAQDFIEPLPARSLNEHLITILVLEPREGGGRRP